MRRWDIFNELSFKPVLPWVQLTLDLCVPRQAEIPNKGPKNPCRLDHIFTSGSVISVPIFQTGGVWFCLSLRLLTVPCCDRLHRGCSPSIHFCPSPRSSPSPSVAPFRHRRPDSLPIRLSVSVRCRVPTSPPVGLTLVRCDRSRVKTHRSLL